MPNPLNIINTLLPSSAVDTVAIFDQNYNELFNQAKSIKAVIKEQSKLMEHPIETGAIITDHRIIMPIEIDLSLILASSDYQDVYKSIRQYFFQATLLIVQTRAGIYQNQIISALPHEEDPNMYDALTIALSLKQVLYVIAQYTNVPKYPANASTIDRGQQQGTPANTKQTSVAFQGFSSAANYFKNLSFNPIGG
jgi:hypothetical protein